MVSDVLNGYPSELYAIWLEGFISRQIFSILSGAFVEKIRQIVVHKLKICGKFVEILWIPFSTKIIHTTETSVNNKYLSMMFVPFYDNIRTI